MRRVVGVLGALLCCGCWQPLEESADAGVPDGSADAGALRDSGVLALDAGALDAGTPSVAELCDGFDNNRDGLVDRTPDGGLLSRPCLKSLGVCALARSYCIDAGYGPCDYGPDFQEVETRCDGLDNDCDGRIDKSAAHVIVPGDGGFSAYDLGVSQVIRRDGGWLLNLANETLFFNDQLKVTGRWEASPYIFGAESILEEDGENWIRFRGRHGVQPPATFRVESVEAGGVVRLIADIELADVISEGFAVLPNATGWSMASISGSRAPVLIKVERDGGVNATPVDAGTPFTITASRHAFYTQSNACTLRRCDANMNCTTVFDSTSSDSWYCAQISETPSVILTPQQYSYVDGGPYAGVATLEWGHSNRAPVDETDSTLLVTRLAADGGDVDYSILRPAGVTAVEHTTHARYDEWAVFQARLTQFDEHAALLTWPLVADAGVSSQPSEWPLNSVKAEYICLP